MIESLKSLLVGVGLGGGGAGARRESRGLTRLILANKSETVQVDLCIAGGSSAMGFMVIFVLCG